MERRRESKVGTVESLISHTPRWIAQAVGYQGLWALRGQFGDKFQFGSGPNPWVMVVAYERYGL